MLDGLIESVTRSTTLDELERCVFRCRDILDVEHVVYHAVNPSGGQYAALTYSPDWVDRYLSEDFARIDPVVAEGIRSFRAFDWRSLDWSGKPVRDFLEEAEGAGVGSEGLTIPIHGPAGQFAMFTLSDRAKPSDWTRKIDAQRSEVILLAHYLNETARRIDGGGARLPERALSPRESDALRMLAVGRSRAQAAEALSISEHTLRVYIEGARDKLGASNTTHAVAKALASGLITV